MNECHSNNKYASASHVPSRRGKGSSLSIKGPEIVICRACASEKKNATVTAAMLWCVHLLVTYSLKFVIKMHSHTQIHVRTNTRTHTDICLGMRERIYFYQNHKILFLSLGKLRVVVK
jgi:hypothetical protein